MGLGATPGAAKPDLRRKLVRCYLSGGWPAGVGSCDALPGGRCGTGIEATLVVRAGLVPGAAPGNGQESAIGLHLYGCQPQARSVALFSHRLLSRGDRPAVAARAYAARRLCLSRRRRTNCSNALVR